eukprot:jgi/Tetstr1/430429/TSEL_020239.t1
MAAVIRPEIAALMVSVCKISAATWRGENVVSDKWTIRSSAWLHDTDSAALLLQEEAAVEEHPAGQPAGKELHVQEAAVELLAEEAAVEQPQTDEEDMPLSDEHDSDFMAEESDGDDDIAEIVSSAPPERDEAIDLCEDIDAREEDVIDFANDDEDVSPVATFKQMFEDSVMHVQIFVEEKIEQATWGGEQYRVVPPAVDSEIGQVLKTLQLLDPTLQDVSVAWRELYLAMEKVLLNHTVSTPYMVQY